MRRQSTPRCDVRVASASLARLAIPASPTRSAERSLRLLLVATLAVPLLLLAGLAWHLHGSHFAQARLKLDGTLDLLLEHAVKVFETHELAAGQVDQILYGMTDEEIRARERDVHGRLAAVTRPLEQVLDVWVLDRDGRPLVGANVYPYASGLELSDREYFRVHRDDRVPPRSAYVSEVLRGRALDGSPLQLFSKRRGARDPSSTAEFTGVTAIAVNLAYFERFYARIVADGLTNLKLVRADGAVLVRHPALPGSPTQSRLRGGLLGAIPAAPERGAFENVAAVGGAVRLVGYRRLPNYPLYVMAGLDRGTVVRGWLLDLATHLAFAVPAVAGLFLLTLLALRRTRSAAAAAAKLRDEVARREEAEQRLVQAQRMEAVGQLTAGIAHDFNNLLQAQMAGLDLLLDEVQGHGESGCFRPERACALIERALAAGSRGARLTHHLLAFSRKQVLQPEVVSLPGLLAELGHVLTRTLGPQVELRVVVAPGAPSPFVDAAQLESALLNLCLNARDAMSGGGRLVVHADMAEVDGAEAGADRTGTALEDLVPGRYVRIAVTDSGTGMDAATLARACEPFFTTKGVGRGSGLGLSMVQGFARQSGGALRIRSRLGEGTRIEIWLPSSEARSSGGSVESTLSTWSAKLTGAATAPEMASPIPGADVVRGGRVLLVDDAPELLELMGDMLDGAGFEVVRATNGKAALAALRDDGPFDALVTDYAMPGVSGAALIGQARAALPRLPALVITGYADGVEAGDIPRDVRVLRKPFRADALAQAVGCLLADAAGPVPPRSAAPPHRLARVAHVG